ncbi:DNA helicase, UvrD/REP type, partial [mine drainage metagenome]
DEYQDTNKAQFVIAHMLAMNHKNICATGDPDQSIYGWRGADIQNILEFEEFFPGAKVVRLEQNYRSTKVILKAASALIENNRGRKKKDLWTENESGEKITLVHARDQYQEAQEVVRMFQAAQGKTGLTWDKMAIFYRTNALSRVVEDALMKAGVPYQIVRGTEFYGRKEVKDVLAY